MALLFAEHGVAVSLNDPSEEAMDSIIEDAKKEGKEWKEREAPKPLHIIQPEGVSFKIDGHVLEWQKWKMHIGITCHKSAFLRT